MTTMSQSNQHHPTTTTTNFANTANTGKTTRSTNPQMVAHENKLKILNNQIEDATQNFKHLKLSFADADTTSTCTTSTSTAESLKEEKQKLFLELSSIKEKIKLEQDARRLIIQDQEAIREERKKKQKQTQEAIDKLPFRTLQEYDNRIRQIEGRVEGSSGVQCTLAEEKGLVAEISKLKKSRRSLEVLLNNGSGGNGFDGASSGMLSSSSVNNSPSLTGSDPLSVKLRMERSQEEIARRDLAITSFKSEMSVIYSKLDEVSLQLSSIQKVKKEDYLQRKEQYALLDKEREKIDALWKEKKALLEAGNEMRRQAAEARQKKEERWLAGQKRRDLESQKEKAVAALEAFDEGSDSSGMKGVSECMSLISYIKETYPVSESTSASTSSKKKIGLGKLPFGVMTSIVDLSLPLPTTQNDLPSLLESLSQKMAHFRSEIEREEGKREARRSQLLLAIEEAENNLL